jgi:dipeptidyl aminopeptidase/acylaminoacyl peptidase
MNKRLSIIILTAVALLAVARPARAQKPVGSDFFTHVNRISNLKAWNSNLFFTVTRADKEKNNYSSDLYQLLDGGPTRIAQNVSDYFFQDGGIIFRERPQDVAAAGNQPEGGADKHTVFMKLSRGYGEAAEWLRLPFRASDIEWIANDAFFYTSPYSRDTSASRDYHEYDELPFWANGRGDVSGRRQHLYFYNKGTSVLLCDTLESVGDILLSPDRKTLVYTLRPAWRGKQPDGGLIVSVDAASLRKREWKLFDRASFGNLAFISNGEIVFSANRSLERDRIENPGIYRLDLGSGNLAEVYDGSYYAIGNSVGSDIGGAGRQEITFDDKGLRFITTDVDYAPLVHLPWAGGKARRLSGGRLSVLEYRPYKNGFAVIGYEGQNGAEVYFIGPDGNPQALTGLNRATFGQYNIVEPVEIKYKSSTGADLVGYVLPPAGYEPGRKYPAILDIHGGPKTAYGSVFFHEMQYWASEGYAVFFANPKGSSGRGSAFSDIRGQMGGVDYEDLMAFTDAALAQAAFIDPNRLGVTGGSYGGLMTNWIIGHTGRFKAAASQRGISSWLTFSNTSDIGHTFTHTYWGTDLWKNAPLLWEASPLKYADRVTTPTLFIHSAQDYRCWLVEGLQMYYALQYHGVPSRIVVFENESHELSRSGKPLNRIKRLEEIKGWFDKYLKN